MLATATAHSVSLADLTRSKVHPNAYRTPDDVALGAAYVQQLLASGRNLVLATSTRRGPVVLHDGDDVVGVLMPLNLPPELASLAEQPSRARELGTPCPACQQQVPMGGGFCEACGQGLSWTDDATLTTRYPAIESGRPLWSQSFETTPLPGGTGLEERRQGALLAWPVPGGKLVSYPRAITSSYVEYSRVLRDACVRATFTPLDPGARIGLVARHAIVGGIQLYYLFDVMPLAGRAWCSRAVQAPQSATSSNLGKEVSFTPTTAGHAMELELRIAGATLRCYINRQPIIDAHDAVFSSGGFGIRVGREHDISHPVRIICHGYEVSEVTA